ncbi:MAG: DUF1292 domain-containing protein [Firmicutes bacterium]|nr:DUF1292 domain-containing protein [Candidatus Fermentithermobacillaceae bacterium]
MENWNDFDSAIELEDENGQVHRFFLVYDHLMAGGKQYVVLLPEEERDSDEPLVVILRLDRENGEYVLHNITDDDEWERVSKAWEEVEMEELIFEDEDDLEEDEDEQDYDDEDDECDECEQDGCGDEDDEGEENDEDDEGDEGRGNLDGCF